MTQFPDFISFHAGLALKTRTVDADYTADFRSDRVVICDTSSDPVTVTFPPAASCHDGRAGVVLTLVALSASNDVTVDGDGSETVDGSATATVSGAYASASYISDGTQWISIQ